MQVILGVPGFWSNVEELEKRIETFGEGYVLAGRMLHNPEKKIVYQAEIVAYDAELKAAFRHGGEEQLGDELLNKIDKHNLTVYIVAHVQNYEEVKEVIDVGMMLLDNGGIAIKIETTGKAHTKEKWRQLTEAKEHYPIYSMFVSLVMDKEGYVSFGMKTFGLPDVKIPRDISPELAADSMNKFNLYQIFDRPYFKDNEKVKMQNGTPTYYIHIKEDERYPKDHPYYNPLGVIHLAKNPK